MLSVLGFCLSPLGSARGSVWGGDRKPALPVAGPVTWAREQRAAAWAERQGGRAKPCGSALPGVWFPSLLRPGCTLSLTL